MHKWASAVGWVFIVVFVLFVLIGFPYVLMHERAVEKVVEQYEVQDTGFGENIAKSYLVRAEAFIDEGLDSNAFYDIEAAIGMASRVETLAKAYEMKAKIETGWYAKLAAENTAGRLRRNEENRKVVSK